jgi:hypothetical protein
LDPAPMKPDDSVVVVGQAIEITCLECCQAFEFGVEEQQFFAARNFAPPRRCYPCRRARRRAEIDARRREFDGV